MFRRFLRDFRQDWIVIMSGIGSIISTAIVATLSYFGSSPTAHAIFVLTAFGCIVWSSYRVWLAAVERGEATALAIQVECEKRASSLEEDIRELKGQMEVVSPYDTKLITEAQNELALMSETEKAVATKLMMTGRLKGSQLESLFSREPRKWQFSNVTRLISGACVLVDYYQHDETFGIVELYRPILKKLLFPKND